MHDVLDLARYPLHDPDGAGYAALVVRAQADLAAAGMFNLPGFLRPDATARTVATLAPRFAGESFTHARRHNIYFRKSIPELPADHPALTEVETINRTLCGDQIGGVLQALYDWPDFARFLAATMGKPALYPMDDPLAGLNAMNYAEGQGLNWHFDRSEFTTTLLLQAPDEGGAFEYRTDLRTDSDPNYDGVARLLRGQDPALQSITLTPGTLNVFRGKNTAHRVTPVRGDKDRIIAVFSFYDRPGVRFTAEEQKGFYGRAA
jgi:2OG-Fe(II) oxygenase superfamily